uniref:Trichome birefringence-like N-terminal domain-containing protein n=1 Tax=Kalanchoe fedtschenkoi TaxID=63787 RepID=A0A7N0U2J3_KALFE
MANKVVMMMMNNPSSSFSSLSLSNHKHTLLLKLLISFLLSGLAFRLILSNYSISISSQTEHPPPPHNLDRDRDRDTLFRSVETDHALSHQLQYNFTDHTNDEAPLRDFQENSNHENGSSQCDIFVGKWVRDPSGPRYTNETCRFIEPPQNCMRNGRPDSDYLYWRWSPRDCELPTLDAPNFLNLMRHKSWAFIGDSISRNHVQSLLCILSQVEEATEVYHDEEFKSKRWYFPGHNFTLSVIWSPYLVKADVFEDNDGHSSAQTQIYLDTVDPIWSQQYTNFDYIIFAGGKWFLKTAIYYENRTIVGCHYCPGRNLTELGYDFGYRKAIRRVLDYMTKSSHKPLILFRTTAPDHFENGEWFSGGTCNRTEPFNEGEAGFKDVDTVMMNVELEEFQRAENVALKKGIKLKLFDTSKASLLRPDGHPGPYRNFQPFSEGGGDGDGKLIRDCLHWCLPGPIDYWNDLIMYALSH